MPRLLSADDLIPLVASLTDRERTRLLRWIAAPHGADATAYEAAPPTPNEFEPGDEPLAWDADGWDDLARNSAASSPDDANRVTGTVAGSGPNK